MAYESIPDLPNGRAGALRDSYPTRPHRPYRSPPSTAFTDPSYDDQSTKDDLMSLSEYPPLAHTAPVPTKAVERETRAELKYKSMFLEASREALEHEREVDRYRRLYEAERTDRLKERAAWTHRTQTTVAENDTLRSKYRDVLPKLEGLEREYALLVSDKRELDLELASARAMLAMEDQRDLSDPMRSLDDLNEAVDELAFNIVQSIQIESSAQQSSSEGTTVEDDIRYTPPPPSIEAINLAFIRSVINDSIVSGVFGRYHPGVPDDATDFWRVGRAILDVGESKSTWCRHSAHLLYAESQQKAASWRRTTFDALERITKDTNPLPHPHGLLGLVSKLGSTVLDLCPLFVVSDPVLAEWRTEALSILNRAADLHRLFQRGFMSTNLHLLYFPHSSISHSFDATRMESSENDVEDGTAASKVGAGTGLICLATTAFGLEQSTRKETSPGGFVTERTVLMKAKVETMRSLG
jgi:hypothetical protein